MITSFAYKLKGEEGDLVVATTRPETMLGEVTDLASYSAPFCIVGHVLYSSLSQRLTDFLGWAL